MQIKKIMAVAGMLIMCSVMLTACEDDSNSDQNLNNQTETQITQSKGKSDQKPVKARPVATKNVQVSHDVKFNGKTIPVTATYGIDQRYVNNWYFTDNEEIMLSIKPDKEISNIDLGVNNIYADVAIASRYMEYNGIRQDSLNQSYSDMPNGFVSINKQNSFDLPFQVESINENEVSFHMIDGCGGGHSDRIDEDELRGNAYGAKLNVVWTLAIKDKGQIYFKTLHDTIGLPYKAK